uniref:Transthyretin-like family protein n=1 Tax=Haemonchus contortus TaxID=6289 RepID=A0A7I5EBJ0_HAECO
FPIFQMRAVFVFLALVLVATLIDAKKQSVTVKGVTVCNKKRLADATVELWERDRLDPNDLLMTMKTKKDGEFLVKGEEDEVGGIEPFLRITHTCNVKKPGCKRISEYEIPKKFVDGVYDMTYVTLDIISAVDKEKC